MQHQHQHQHQHPHPHPHHNQHRQQRHSRRSACNRCRTYKLRCERSSVHDNSCQRCLRTGVVCSTTNSELDGSPRRGAPPQTNQNQNRAIFPRSENAVSDNSPTVAVTSPNTTSNNNYRHGFSSGSRQQTQSRTSSDLVGLGTPMMADSSIDFTFSEFTFPDHGSQDDIQHPELGGGGEGNGTWTAVQWSPDQVGLDPGMIHGGGPVPPPDSAIALTNSTSPSAATSTSFTPGGGDTSMSGSEPPAPSSPATVMQDLFELCARLTEDNQDTLKNMGMTCMDPQESGQHVMETAVQQALERSSRLSDLLVQMAAMESTSADLPRSSSNSSGSIGGSSNNTNHHQHRRKRAQPDPTAVSILTTTYILLVRTWRNIFLQLYRLLQELQQHATCHKSCSRRPSFTLLPSLQLGGFTVQNNPTIQVVALIELSSGMLGAIECRLGISQQQQTNQHHQPHQSSADADVGGANTTTTLKAFTDPLSISIRETMISQEILRIATNSTDTSCPSNTAAGNTTAHARTTSTGTATCCLQNIEGRGGREDESGLDQLTLRELMDEVRKCV